MKKAIIIAGPTAVGKTRLSVELAKRWNAEIISADSMQIYRHMNIGTAKVTQEERKGIRHHLIDIVDPNEGFTVADFQREALQAVDDIISRGKLPLIVGGTGLYINSLLYDMDFQNSDSNEELRKKLWERYEKEGEESLLSLLSSLDQKKAGAIDKKNIKRVIRAIEIASLQKKNKDFSSDCRERGGYEFLLFVLTTDRAILYERINQRVLQMIDDGLIEEVKKVSREFSLTKHSQSMMGIGYRQVLEYLSGETSREQMVEEICKQSRRYAKRQLTWFKRYQKAVWIDVEGSFDEIMKRCTQRSENFLIK